MEATLPPQTSKTDDILMTAPAPHSLAPLLLLLLASCQALPAPHSGDPAKDLEPGGARGQEPGDERGQEPGDERGQEPGDERGQEPEDARGQEPGDARGVWVCQCLGVNLSQEQKQGFEQQNMKWTARLKRDTFIGHNEDYGKEQEQQQEKEQGQEQEQEQEQVQEKNQEKDQEQKKKQKQGGRVRREAPLCNCNFEYPILYVDEE